MEIMFSWRELENNVSIMWTRKCVFWGIQVTWLYKQFSEYCATKEHSKFPRGHCINWKKEVQGKNKISSIYQLKKHLVYHKPQRSIGYLLKYTSSLRFVSTKSIENLTRKNLGKTWGASNCKQISIFLDVWWYTKCIFNREVSCFPSTYHLNPVNIIRTRELTLFLSFRKLTVFIWLCSTLTNFFRHV